MKKESAFNVVLLSGGIGRRMGTSVPKQYLPIHDKPVALYSFEFFLSLPEVRRIVVVCEPSYQSLFKTNKKTVRFAKPGKERQDSVFNGFQNLESKELVCIHDAARPLIQSSLVRQTVEAARQWGAAALGVRVKGTIKRCDEFGFVLDTPKRSNLWEMQTPQVLRFDLLKQGLELAQERKTAVTDDVSLVELLNLPVKIVEGSDSNLKITTQEDLIAAERLLRTHVYV